MKLKFNADYHTYWLDGKQAKGVTTVAKIGTNTYNLEQYALRMTAIGVAKTPALVEAIAVNYDDRAKMKDLCYQAQKAAKAFDASDRGTTLHQVTERHDLGLGVIETESNVKIRKAWAQALEDHDLAPCTEWVERVIVYPDYRLCGTLDRILYSHSGDALVIADAKGGQNAVKYPHAIAVQLALYANAPLLAGRLNAKGETTTFEPMPDVDKTTGYVIWMPEDDRAEVVTIDIRAGWECFNDVILPTLKWQARDDLVIRRGPDLLDQLEESTRAAAGSALGEVAPAAAHNQEATCPTTTTQVGESPSATNSSKTGEDFENSGNTLSASSSSASTAPAYTTDQQTLKSRLHQLRTDQPAVANAVIAEWPIAPKGMKDDWTDDETAQVAAVLDRHDIEGGYITDDEFQRVCALVDTLTPAQRERVAGWVREAAAAPGRDLSLGGGWRTVRRVCLAEVCALWAKGGFHDEFVLDDLLDAHDGWAGIRAADDRESSDPSIGATLAAMNWREAQHLLAIIRLHLNLDATITQETNQ